MAVANNLLNKTTEDIKLKRNTETHLFTIPSLQADFSYKQFQVLSIYRKGV